MNDRSPPQTSYCAACGLAITERERKPCPRCKGMNRDHVRRARDIVTTNDRAG